MDLLAKHWWGFAIRGIVALFFGLAAFIWPRLTLNILVALFGAFVFIDGILSIITAFGHKAEYSQWWLLLLEGVASVLIGIFAFTWPGITALFLILLIAFWALATGILEIVAAIWLRKIIAGEWGLALSGILSVVFSLILLLRPSAGALAVIWVIGLYAIFFGLLLLYLAFKLRSLKITLEQGLLE